ncbi:hypothetical protein Tco_1021561 [Tanacetum coccineum]
MIDILLNNETTTDRFYDDVDIRLNEPVDTDKGFVQEEATDAAMTIKTEVPVTSSSHSFDLAAKVTTLEQEVAELKKDPLHTQVIALVDDNLDARLGVTRDEFMNFLSRSLTARITEQVQNQLPEILPEEVSNFALPGDPKNG